MAIPHPETTDFQSNIGARDGAGTTGLHASIGGASISMDEETSRSLFETLFTKDNIEIFAYYAVPIVLIAITAKMVKYYWNKTEHMTEDAIASTIVRGEAEITSNDHHEILHVGKKPPAGTVAQTLVSKGGHLKSTATGGSSIMTVGLENEGINSTNKVHENIAGDKLKVTVRFPDDVEIEKLVLHFAKDDMICDLRKAIKTQHGMDCNIKRVIDDTKKEALDDYATFDDLQKKYPDILVRYLYAEKRT